MATTINNYSVGLSLEASDYIRNSKLSRNETNRLIREINRARTPADNYTRSLNLIDKALKQGAISQATYNQLLDASKSKLAGAATSASNFGSRLAGIAGAYVGFSAIKSLVTDSVMLAAEAESAAIQFEVLTGSVAESAEMVAGLRQLAAVSPLGMRDTQQAAKVMLSFGVATEDILPTLKMLGDVTGGNKERFKMMALAFAQMSAAGRMMGQDLLQMVNAGFNPLQEISRKTGESMIELKKLMEAGGIATAEIAAAFKSATSEGGMFFGMIDRMAGTTEGKLNILKDKVDQLKISMGEAMLEIMQPETGPGLQAAGGLLDRLTQGMKVIADGGMHSLKARHEAEMENLKQQKFFADSQIRRRREGRPTIGGMTSDQALNMFTPAQKGAASHGIESAIQSTVTSVGSMASTVLSGLSTFQDAAEMISMAGVAQTQELVTSMKESPAVKNLQVGTQEAYAALTQATSEAEKSSRIEARRQQQLAENAQAQREKLLVYMERMNQALENNGFKRIR